MRFVDSLVIALAAAFMGCAALAGCASSHESSGERVAAETAKPPVTGTVEPSTSTPLAHPQGPGSDAEWSRKSADLLTGIHGCELDPSMTEDFAGDPFAALSRCSEDEQNGGVAHLRHDLGVVTARWRALMSAVR